MPLQGMDAGFNSRKLQIGGFFFVAYWHILRFIFELNFQLSGVSSLEVKRWAFNPIEIGSNPMTFKMNWL